MGRKAAEGKTFSPFVASNSFVKVCAQEAIVLKVTAKS